ncbi:MAG: hypothetical protein ACK5X3_12375 [Pseudomonadota bacterium]
MTQAKHTPGPWAAEDNFIMADVDVVALVRSKDFDAATNAANARLIAAAPDLLAALEHMYYLYLSAAPNAFANGVTDSTGTIDEGEVLASVDATNARAAIAKARGEAA